jgi:hypothetical protein
MITVEVSECRRDIEVAVCRSIVTGEASGVSRVIGVVTAHTVGASGASLLSVKAGAPTARDIHLLEVDVFD